MLYREAEPALNMRRPFSFDLVYPFPELKPVIGKIKPVKESTQKHVTPKPRKDK